MRILIADDEPVARAHLEHLLASWHHEPIVVANGADAVAVMKAQDGPPVAFLDWEMPDINGDEVCRRIREGTDRPMHLILLTAARTSREDRLAGLSCGADDFVAKPFDPAELRARLAIAERVVSLQEELMRRIRELASSLEHIRQLEGLLPICPWCKSIRDEHQAWHSFEQFLSQRGETQITHAICPRCRDKYRTQLKAEAG